MKTSIQLKQERKAISDKIEALQTLVKTENRGFTAEELTTLENDLAEERNKGREIEAALELEKRAASLAGNKPADDPEKREVANFSFQKFLREASKNNLTGLELEMTQEGLKEMRTAGAEPVGYAISNKVMVSSRSALTTSVTSPYGGYLIPTEKIGFFDALYAKTVLAGLGTEYMTGLTSNVDLPGVATGASVGWATETAPASDAGAVLGQVSLRPKRLTAYQSISKALMAQTGGSVEQYLINTFIAAMAAKLENGAINGSGSSGEPTGLLSSGTTVAIDTNGGALTSDLVLKLEATVTQANADKGSLHYLTNGKVRQVAKTLAYYTNSPAPIWNGDMCNGYTSAVTSNVPSTLTKGTSSGVCSAMIFGNFEDLIIGQFGALDVTVDPYTQAGSGEIVVTLNSYFDVGVRHSGSFAYLKDITFS
jgi:HK97 family phage major capsid protein